MRIKTSDAVRCTDPHLAVRGLIERGYPGVRQAILLRVAAREDRTTGGRFRDKRTQAARSAHPRPNLALPRFEQRSDGSTFIASAPGRIMFDAPVRQNAIETLTLTYSDPQISSPVLNDR